MHIVIDIPDNDYKSLVNPYQFNEHLCSRLKEIVRQGTPLPKGHGSLKDFEKLYADMSEREELARQRVIDTPSNSPCYMRYVSQLNERTSFKEMLHDTPTIIEADKESEDKE